MELEKQKISQARTALAAKKLCSGIFVSKREADDVFSHSVAVDGMPEQPTYRVDYETKRVTAQLGDITSRAQFYGDQGCAILPDTDDQVYFQPVPVCSTLPDPTTQRWPMGDLSPDRPLPTGVDLAKVTAALNIAFANPADHTAAYLVVYQGQIIAERYAPGIVQDTQLESWSMGKSITAALIGILIKDRHFDLESPAPIPAWRAPGDPRSAITMADLLRMSSGLQCTGRDEAALLLSDHDYPYTGPYNVFAHALNRSVEHPPNTVGRYRNCDPLALGYIIRQTVEGRGEDYLTFPQRALFDRIGIRKQVLETDPYGNFILTGFDFGAPRNWARFGLLHLQDGVWQGERILPTGWVDFVSSPAPAWENGEYGGLFWVNSLGENGLPTDAYSAQGIGGQRTYIAPSHNLVIVRMGHLLGRATFLENLTRANRLIIEAIL